jgi:hypothetical protein
MYAPDLSDWFFCEVKGPGDRLGVEQETKFKALAVMSVRPVRILRFRWAPLRKPADGILPGVVGETADVRALKASAKVKPDLRSGVPSLLRARVRCRDHPRSGSG